MAGPCALMPRTCRAWASTTSLADPTDVAAMRAAIRPETRMILVEVVSNPTLARRRYRGPRGAGAGTGILLVVDNTFTTPRGFRAFDHGADIVIHSVTKLLAGHSDVTLGYVAARDPDLNDPDAGLCRDARDARQPVRLLAGRARHAHRSICAMTGRRQLRRLADHLAELPGVKRVLYPGRADHPDQSRAVALLGDSSATW